jgi:hypothetical protein
VIALVTRFQPRLLKRKESLPRAFQFWIGEQRANADDFLTKHQQTVLTAAGSIAFCAKFQKLLE